MTSLDQPYERTQAALFLAATLCAVVASHFLQGGVWLVALAFGGIAVAVWHGAFDNVLAKEALAPRFGRHWQRGFYPAYLALGVVCLALWLVVPVWVLVLFLGYSAVHFGTERERVLTPGVLVTGFATGLVPIAAACRWWPQQVEGIFGEMLRGETVWAARVATFAGLLLWPTIGLALLGVLRGRRTRAGLPVLLLAAQMALFRWCSPLPAFAVYFCVWHTPEHLVSTSLDRGGQFSLRTMGRHLRAGAGLWLLSLTAVGAACWFGRHTVNGYASMLFIALSALTVPHMVLGEVCRRQQRHAGAVRGDVFDAGNVVLR